MLKVESSLNVTADADVKIYSETDNIKCQIHHPSDTETDCL